MEPDSLLFSFFLIFSGAALASTLALFFRQPLLVAYIFIGGLLGPFGVGYISNSSLLTDIAEFGIIFLLDRKSTRLNSSHALISYAVFCLKKKKNNNKI